MFTKKLTNIAVRCYNCKKEFNVDLYEPLSSDSIIVECCSNCGNYNKISGSKIQKPNDKTMNPTNESLENLTTFNVELRIPLTITVPQKESEFNQQITNQRTACQKVQRTFDFGIFTLENKQFLKKQNIELKEPMDEIVVMQCVPKDEKWLDFNGRCFDHMLFDGNGDYSIRNREILITRLNNAFDMLSGLQQGAEDDQADIFIENVAKDVVMALTGKEIQL